MWSFPLFPPQAATMAPQVDALFFFVLAVTVFFSLLIAVAILYLAIKYRADSKADRSNPVDSHLLLEITWSGIPLLITLVIFAWGAHVFYRMQIMPPNAEEVFVVGKRWMWKIQHAGGQREIDALHVPTGRPISLTMISEDVIHDFAVPAFRIKEDVIPGRYTKEWFQATKTGEYHLFCDQYCGTLHSEMIGTVYVMTPVDYQAWLDHWTAPSEASKAPDPAELFNRFACSSCHISAGQGRGPSLAGLFGQKVQLSDGSSVIADDAYLRESIVRPAAKIVMGYGPIMPSYQGQINEQDLHDLIAYIKTLGGTPSTTH